jgi:outer membrane immunogenic protein
MLNKVLLTTSITVLMSSTAMAADPFSWSGGYIGANAGYESGKFNTDFTSTITLGTIPPTIYRLARTQENNVNGYATGIQAGYNWQLNRNWILGLEADIQTSSLKNTFSGGTPSSVPFGSYTVTTKLQWLSTVRARLGYAVTERLMIYGTAGLSYANINTEYKTLGSFNGIGEFSGSSTSTGKIYGVGAEYALNNNWSIKSEYLYTDLGKTNVYGKVPAYTSTDIDLNTKIQFNTLRIGVNYKF